MVDLMRKRKQSEPKKTVEEGNQDKESVKVDKQKQVNPEKDPRTRGQKEDDKVWDSFNVPQKIREETGFLPYPKYILNNSGLFLFVFLGLFI